jgi:hypothetical protein
MYQQEVLGNLRRAQGLIRKSHALIQLHGHSTASPWITQAIDHMIRFNHIRVSVFEKFVKNEQKKNKPQEDRTIVRKPGNPMLRRAGGSVGVVAISGSATNHSNKESQ